jgi:cobalt/nickel transport system permease protein
MASLDAALLDFRRMDRLAGGETALHRLDPRAKLLVTLIFIVTVISFDKYAVTGMIPLFIFPVVMVSLGDLPPGYIAGKVLLLAPLAAAAGLFNPLLDRGVLLHLGSLGVTGGWVSFSSILLRALLTIGAALILVAVTGLPGICQALEQLGAPRLFAVQLLLLHRYLFVLMEEGAKVSRARELHSFGKKGQGIGSFAPLVGNLLLRTWRRAERLHLAMCVRGFTGEFHTRRTFRFGTWELLFLSGWSLLFMVVRLNNIPYLLGKTVAVILG